MLFKTMGISVLSALAFTGMSVFAQPGHSKLPAPTNVVCPVVETAAVITFDAVPDAVAYQVEYVDTLEGGFIVQESDFVTDVTDSVALDDFTSLIIQVRALPAPKHAGGPVQGVGPKGQWSDPCVVAIPVAE